jgi:ribonuclease I
MYECGSGQKVKLFIRDNNLKDLMHKYWIAPTFENEKFWEHEYNKHGLCYTEEFDKKQEDYFRITMEIYQKYKLSTWVKIAIGNVKGSEYSVEYDKLKGLLYRVNPNVNFIIRCVNEGDKQYLESLRIPLDIDFKPAFFGSSNCNYKQNVIIRLSE